jgi:hypothetical protein
VGSPVRVIPFKYKNLSGAATTVVKTGRGTLHSIVIVTTAAAAVTVFDNTAGSGAVIATFAASAALGTYLFDLEFKTGLTLVLAGASELVVTYE